MATLSRLQVSLLLILVVCPAGYGKVCLGKDQETGIGTQQVLHLEQLWKAGRKNQYYQEAAKMANDILAGSATAKNNEAAVQLLESLLAKAAISSKATVEDLFGMQKVSSYLVSNANLSTDDRRANAPLLCKYLGEIRNEIVPNYQPQRVTENVAPPPGIAGVAGMDPDAIADPVAREKYKEAIRKNREANLMNTRQWVLEGIQRKMSAPIVAYVIEALGTPGTPPALINECIKNARLTDAERKTLEAKIGTTRK